MFFWQAPRVRVDVTVGEIEVSVDADGVGSFLRTSTRDIWDDKLMGRIEQYYSTNAVLHGPGGETRHGSDQMLADVLAWLAAFPDLRVFVDDAIWSEDGAEWRTAVRETVVGHNRGPSRYGPPSGRRVVFGRIIHSRVRNNRFVEQWIEWDEIGLMRQLGLDERQIAAGESGDEASRGSDDELALGVTAWEPAGLEALPEDQGMHVAGPDLIQAAVDAVWNARLPGAVSRYYTERYRAEVSGRRIFGIEEVQGEVVAMLAAFPDLRVHIDDVICREERDGQHLSTRWTLLGTNTGSSRYGPPSDRYVRLTGISQHRVRDGRFQEGWTEYGELSLLRQIAPVHELVEEGEISG